ncbi:hypothetical protein QYF36_007026 [Acer negundo]|nr:hypothetical protein QYF36_007026 [Acer negundo]
MGPQPLPLSIGLDIFARLSYRRRRNFRAERGGKAGGWSIELSKKRTLEEAFVSIWVCMTSQPQTHSFLHALVKLLIRLFDANCKPWMATKIFCRRNLRLLSLENARSYG